MKVYLSKHYEPLKPKDKQHVLIDQVIKNDRISVELLENDFDVIAAAKEGFHIVSLAFIGLTNFSSVCRSAFNIDQPEQESYITPINTKKETGTMYPKHNLTILPYRYRTTAGMTVGTYDHTHGEGFSIDEICSHIKDALLAETEYIKAGKIVFDFRDLGEDMRRYTNATRRILSDEYSDMDWKIYMFSSDNTEWENV